MKKLAIIPLMLFLILPLSIPVLAATTVTVDDNKVIIDRNQPNTITVVQQALPKTIVVQRPVIVTRTEDPRELEGEIIRVDYPGNQIVVQDIDGIGAKFKFRFFPTRTLCGGSRGQAAMQRCCRQ